MKLVLVHGFNVRDGGAHTVDTLAPFIQGAGHDVDMDEGDYGFFNLFMVRLFKSRYRMRVLYRLARAFETADVIITHSNGALFCTQAMDLLGPEYNNKITVIHISPALDCDTAIPQGVKRQLVLYTPHDGWVRLATYLPFHPWGRMGARGYKGMDNRNTNIMRENITGHSKWFDKRHVRATWQLCKRFLETK